VTDPYEELLAQREEIEAPCKPANYRVLKRLASNPGNHFVLSFGGGSLHGLVGNAALAGLVEELGLLEHVKEIWGTSAGAVVGGGLASGARAETVMEIVQGLEGRRTLDYPSKPAIFRALGRFLRTRELPEGLIEGRVFRDAIESGLGVERIEDCEIPCRAITCTDDGHATKVVLREGRLIDAIFASMHIPGVFLPLEEWKGEKGGYFDGGVVEKTPLLSIIEDHLRAGRETRLVVVCTHFDSEARIAKPKGFLQRFISVISRMEDMAWEGHLERVQKAKECTAIVLNPRMKYGSMFDFSMTGFNYLWARRRFKKQLSNAGIARRLDAR